MKAILELSIAEDRNVFDLRVEAFIVEGNESLVSLWIGGAKAFEVPTLVAESIIKMLRQSMDVVLDDDDSGRWPKKSF